jgi:hypothetical protein
MAGKQESKYWMESEGERKCLASNYYIAKDAMGGELLRAPVDFSRPVKVLDSVTADGEHDRGHRCFLPFLSNWPSH